MKERKKTKTAHRGWVKYIYFLDGPKCLTCSLILVVEIRLNNKKLTLFQMKLCMNIHAYKDSPVFAGLYLYNAILEELKTEKKKIKPLLCIKALHSIYEFLHNNLSLSFPVSYSRGSLFCFLGILFLILYFFMYFCSVKFNLKETFII